MSFIKRQYTTQSKRLGLLVYTDKGMFDGLAVGELVDVAAASVEVRAKILADVKRRETMPRDAETRARLRTVSDLIHHADRASSRLGSLSPLSVELTDDVTLTVHRVFQIEELAHDVDVVLTAARGLLKEFE